MNKRTIARVGLMAAACAAMTVARVRADDETTYYDNAVGLMGSKKFGDAEAEFRKSVTFDPRYKEAWQGLADCLKAEGKLAAAKAAQQQADAAPAARGGPPPKLTGEQEQVFALADGKAAAVGNADDDEVARLKKRLAELEAAKAADGAKPPADAAADAPKPKKKKKSVAADIGVPVPKPATPAAVPMPGSLKPAVAAPALPAMSGRDAAGKPKDAIKLSKYNGAEYCDIAAAADGTIHAVYSETPDPYKPSYLYYRASTDGGATWSEPVNLSDDESGTAVGYTRLLVDGAGRVYAIWKYVAKDSLIDGPGGNCPGVLAYRCLSGGAWGRTVRLNKDKEWTYSFYAALDPKGTAHVVWSQIAPDAVVAPYGTNGGPGAANVANLVQQVALDAATPGKPRGLVVPPHINTAEENKAAGVNNPSYEDQSPKHDGIINLRGTIDANGVAHFIGERADPQSLVHFDGAKLNTVYSYIPYKSGNTFNSPATLLVDAEGEEHVIRQPEASEKACIRDYAVGDKLEGPIDAIVANDAQGTISRYEALQLPGGRMAVLASVQQARLEDTELYLTFSDGGGKWSKPLCVTDNKYRQSFFSRDTGGVDNVAQSKSYRPDFASIAADKDGHPLLLMVNVEHTISGFTSGAVTGSGRVVGVSSGFSTDSPMVFFMRP